MNNPPHELFITRTGPNSWEVRRPTAEEWEAILRDYPEWSAAQHELARRAAGQGRGLSEAEWAEKPQTYRAVCPKGCYCEQEMTKGRAEEFGVYGVYICGGCEYAFPPDCEPA